MPSVGDRDSAVKMFQQSIKPAELSVTRSLALACRSFPYLQVAGLAPERGIRLLDPRAKRGDPRRARRFVGLPAAPAQEVGATR